MRISNWSSDVCSSDLHGQRPTAILYYPEEAAGADSGLAAFRSDRRSSATFTMATIGSASISPMIPNSAPNRSWAASTRAGARSTDRRSEEHTSELQSLMRISYAVLCLKKKKIKTTEKIIKLNQKPIRHTINSRQMKYNKHSQENYKQNKKKNKETNQRKKQQINNNLANDIIKKYEQTSSIQTVS